MAAGLQRGSLVREESWPSDLHSMSREVTEAVGSQPALPLLPDPLTGISLQALFPLEKSVPLEHMERLSSGSPVTSSSQCFGGGQ